MYSKVVARQLENARDIALAVGKNADTVAGSLRQRFAAGSAEPAAVEWETVLDLLAQGLVETTSRLVEQDADHQKQLLLEKQGRERRDAGLEKVRNRLRGARFLLDQTFGREKATRYFPDRSNLSRVLPRNLLSLARAMAQVLRGNEVDWPPTSGEPHIPKPQELAAGLDNAAGELQSLLEALAPERSGSVFSRGTKRAELEATRKAVSSTTMVLSGLFRLAGYDYAARHLRPQPRRRARTLPRGEGTPPASPGSPVETKTAAYPTVGDPAKPAPPASPPSSGPPSRT